MTAAEILKKLEQQTTLNSMRILAEQVSDTILLIDRDHHIFWINKAGRYRSNLAEEWRPDEQPVQTCHRVMFGWDYPCQSNGKLCPLTEFPQLSCVSETKIFKDGILYRTQLIPCQTENQATSFYWEIIQEIAPQDRIDYYNEENKTIPAEFLSILEKHFDQDPPNCLQLDDMRITGSILSNLIEKFQHPISMILCSSHHLLSQKTDGEHFQQIQLIYNEILAMRAVMYQMMEFMESFKLEFNPINVNRLITDSLIVVLSQSDYTHVTFNNKLSNIQDYIWGDVISLKFTIQCLLGLLLECVIHKKDPRMMIRSEQTADGSFVSITFESDGLDIPASQLNSLCRKVESQSHSHEQLCLSLSRSIVQFHNGTLSIDYEHDRSLRINITLPLTK